MTNPDSISLAAQLGAGKPADYIRVARALTGAAESELRPMRLGFLSSCTLQFLEPYLVVEGARRGFLPTLLFGGFGQLEQELGSASSAFLRATPDAIVLMLRPEDVAPDAVMRSLDPWPALEALVERLATCVQMLRQHTTAPALVANFATPALVPLGQFDASLAESLSLALARANTQLRDRLAALPGAFVWDYAGLVARHGSLAWSDRRLWALARVPVAAAMQPHVASHLLRTTTALFRPASKCLVLDLDNTLWGGAVGDEGIAGIQLGEEYPGNAFKAFQRVILGLADRGVLLAVASKNDLDVVQQVFREHTEMLLRPGDIAAFQVNWLPKSNSLRTIANELNIGIDSLVFFDDNPVERAEVRVNAPEVAVIEVPTDPLLYPAALLESGYFDQPVLAAEDRARREMYRADAGRRELASRTGTVEDFLASLEMVGTVAPLSPAELARVAQLVGKTNQFNLTTRRHSQPDLAAMMHDPSRVVAWLRMRDRFGDQGLVAVGILTMRDGDAVVDSFLMSCRVMGRHVEQALLAYLVEQARRLECTRLLGEYLPTKKNGMVSDFYPTQGLAPMGEPTEGGATTWVLDLREHSVAWPGVIAREEGSTMGLTEVTR